MSFDSSRRKQGPDAPAKRALRATIEEYILVHRSQNHNPKTIEWHILFRLTDVGSEPGAKGKKLSERSVNCYARSMGAFCNWLEREYA